MAKKHEYIAQNIKVIHRLVKSGDVTVKLLAEYNMYQVYKGYNSVKGKMDRYTFVANDMGTSVGAVIRAVKSMESSV